MTFSIVAGDPDSKHVGVMDLRVDDHADSLPALARLIELSQSAPMLGFRAEMLRRG